MSEQTGLWPEGDYVATLVEGELTDHKGNDRVVLTFDVQGHRKLVYLHFTGGAADISYKILHQLGFSGDFENMQFSPPDDLKIYCKHNLWEGKTSEQWNVSGGFKPAPPDRAKRLAADFRARSGQTKPPTSKPSPAPARSPAPAGNGYAKPVPPKEYVQNQTPENMFPPTTPAAKPPAAPPPPPVESAAEKTFGVSTKNEAWEEFCKQRPNANHDEWHKIVGSVMTKTNKVEGQFGPSEWHEVAELCIPI